MSTSGTLNFFITYQYICTLNEEPTDPGKSLLGLSNLFFTWNFLDRLKQTFLPINLFVAWNHRAHLNSATIDWFVKNWGACSLPSTLRHVLSNFLYMIGLFVRPQTQRERNVVRFSAAVDGEERCVTTLKTAVYQTNAGSTVFIIQLLPVVNPILSAKHYYLLLSYYPLIFMNCQMERRSVTSPYHYSEWQQNQRRQWRQGEHQKIIIYVYINKQQLCTWIMLFWTFLCHRWTTTTWDFLISWARFME